MNGRPLLIDGILNWTLNQPGAFFCYKAQRSSLSTLSGQRSLLLHKKNIFHDITMGNAASAAASATVDGVEAVIDGVGAGIGAVIDVVGAGVGVVVDGVEFVVDSVGDAVGSLLQLFKGKPNANNPTTATIEEYLKKMRQEIQAETELADAQERAKALAEKREEAKRMEEKARRIEEEAIEREADVLKREKEAQVAADRARRDLERARLDGEDLKKREKEAKEREEEVNRLAEEFRQAALNAKKRELEANARALETKKREEEAQKAADDAQKREEQALKDLEQAKFYLERGIQPEVWPTDEEFLLAKSRIQYNPEKIHFVVCGSSGTGKSSLINAFRGLRNNSRQAAPTGVVETTKVITRYPEPRQALPYNRFVWFDCPGAGTLEIPGWQYFNQQGLFVFDIVILVYDSVIISI